MYKFSKRSKDALVGVSPVLVKLMNAAIIDSPDDFTIIEGRRTDATQIKYYTWGRSVLNPNTGALKGRPLGATVTDKNGTTNRSNHQAKASGYGEAVDICPFINAKLDWGNGAAFYRIAKHIKAKAVELNIRITWGGDWPHRLDEPHYELKH